MDVIKEVKSDAIFDPKVTPKSGLFLAYPKMLLLSSFLASFLVSFEACFWHQIWDPGYPNVALWNLPYLDQ